MEFLWILNPAFLRIWIQDQVSVFFGILVIDAINQLLNQK